MVVLNIVRPVAGPGIASLCVVVILGIRKPLEVLLTSNIALESATLPVALTETFCENNLGSKVKFNNTNSVRVRFFIYYLRLISVDLDYNHQNE